MCLRDQNLFMSVPNVCYISQHPIICLHEFTLLHCHHGSLKFTKMSMRILEASPVSENTSEYFPYVFPPHAFQRTKWPRKYCITWRSQRHFQWAWKPQKWAVTTLNQIYLATSSWSGRWRWQTIWWSCIHQLASPVGFIVHHHVNIILYTLWYVYGLSPSWCL